MHTLPLHTPAAAPRAAGARIPVTSGLHRRTLFVHERAHLGGRRGRHRRHRSGAALSAGPGRASLRVARRAAAPGRGPGAGRPTGHPRGDRLGHRAGRPGRRLPPDRPSGEAAAGRAGPLPDVLVHVFRARAAGVRPAADPPPGCRLSWHSPDALPEVVTPLTRAAVTDATAGRSGVLRDVPCVPATVQPPEQRGEAATGPPPSWSRGPGGRHAIESDVGESS